DKDGRYWNAVKGDPSYPFTMHVSQTDYYRPLVVIDPDDVTQTDAVLRSLKYLAMNQGVLHLTLEQLFGDEQSSLFQAALREFANPTPPKPDEPTGLGAVVEDANGEKWVRTGKPSHSQ